MKPVECTDHNAAADIADKTADSPGDSQPGKVRPSNSTIKHEFMHTRSARDAGKASDPNTSITDPDSDQQARDKRENHLDMEVEDVNVVNEISCCAGADISFDEIKDPREKVEEMMEDAKESGAIDSDYDGGDSLPDDVQLSEGCCEEVG